MLEKIHILLVYALIGLSIALWPILIRLMPTTYEARHGISKFLHSRPLIAIVSCLILMAIPLLIAFSNETTRQIVALTCACVLISVKLAFHQGQFLPMTAANVFAVLLITITLPWWCHAKLTWFEVILFVAIVAVVLWVVRRHHLDATTSRVTVVQSAAFMLIIVILSFTTTQLHNETLLIAWHHWGAYIGSSELLLAGARLFLDTPVQYGLGPTLIIASTCGHSCWGGMYFWVGGTTVIFTLLITYLALSITNGKGNKNRIPRWLVLTLCVVCCFFWSGYPAHISLPLSLPSSGGLRFLPALVFVAILIRLDQQFQNRKYFANFGHIAWCIAALWSPESGLYATCIWWPYYMLLRSSNSKSRHELVVNISKAIAALIAVALGLIATFIAVYWLIYRAIPNGSIYFAYALNPPGQLPIDPNGAIWFFIAIVILSSLNNWQLFKQSGNTFLFRRGLLLLLLTYSTFSYFLGRSHDNNILNITPFILLVLLHVFSTSYTYTPKMVASTLLAALLGWSSTFGWDNWLQPSGQLNVFEFNPAWINKVIFETKNDLSPDANKPFPLDAIRALTEIQRDTIEPVTIISNWNGLASADAEAVWSAFHGPANIVLFPSTSRRQFLVNTAKKLKRSGWLIISCSSLRSTLTADFDSAYVRSEERRFDTFCAIRYSPKQ